MTTADTISSEAGLLAIDPLATSDSRATILGVGVTDVTRPRAIELILATLQSPGETARTAFFVNAHTLNLAAADADYRQTLNSADWVFGDGTGVRWAARLAGQWLQDNVNGTDLVPELLTATPGQGYRYFLLGGDARAIAAAAEYAQREFPGWQLAGFHHGFLKDSETEAAALRQIRQARADLVLVGMGNPIQERWVEAHRDELGAAIVMAVGGLFDFWAGSVSRAPRWLRAVGHEWLWRLWQQPLDKAKRYLLGHPLFLLRALRSAWHV